MATTQGREPMETKYGTVEKHVGECRDCGYRFRSDGSYKGYKDVERQMGRHLDGGSPCYDYDIKAIYEDGGEDRV